MQMRVLIWDCHSLCVAQRDSASPMQMFSARAGIWTRALRGRYRHMTNGREGPVTVPWRERYSWCFEVKTVCLCWVLCENPK